MTYCSTHGLAHPCACCSPKGPFDADRQAWRVQAASDLRCISASLEALLNPALPAAERLSIASHAQWLAEAIENRINEHTRQERQR